MNSKLLVGYASKYGSTAEVAAKIGETLREQGWDVDVLPVGEVKQVETYRAVILGSAVQFGQWLPEAMEFLRAHEAQLKALPVAIFSVHLRNLDDNAESRVNREQYTAGVHKLITPTTEGFFAGKMEMARLSFFDSLITRALNGGDCDLRDWDAIRAWAGTVDSGW